MTAQGQEPCNGATGETARENIVSIDADAFAGLVGATRVALVRQVRCWCSPDLRGTFDEYDIAQETYAKAWVLRDGLEAADSESFLRSVISIARNVLRNARRSALRKRRSAKWMDREQRDDLSRHLSDRVCDSFDSELERRDSGQFVVRLVCDADCDDFPLVRARYIEGRSLKQLARDHRVHASTLRRRLDREIERIRVLVAAIVGRAQRR